MPSDKPSSLTLPQKLPSCKQADYGGIPEAKVQVTLNEVTTDENEGWERRVNSYREFKSMQSFPRASELRVSVHYSLSCSVYASWSWVFSSNDSAAGLGA